MLTGLSQPLRTISFEYLPRTTEYVQACLTRLDDLGSYRYKLVGWRVVPFASGTVDVRSRARRRARDARRSASRWGRRRAPVRGRARLRADRGHTQLDGRGFLLGAGARTETVEAFFKQGADDRHDDQGYGRAAGATRRWSPATPRPSASKPARSADPQVPLENNGLASGPIASKSWSRDLAERCRPCSCVNIDHLERWKTSGLAGSPRAGGVRRGRDLAC